MVEMITIIDQICEYLENKGEVETSILRDRLGLKENEMDLICERLEDAGIIEYRKALGRRTVELIRPVKKRERGSLPGKVVDKYEITVHGVKSVVRILDAKEDPIKFYEINTVELGRYTSLFMEYLQELIARKVSLEPTEMIDQRKAQLLEDRFYRACFKIIEENIPKLNPKDKKVLAGILLHEVYGFGKIEPIINDDNLEELVINGSHEPVVVFHKTYGWLKTNLSFTTEEEIYNLATQIARKAGKEINVMHPIMDAHLPNGNRVSATLFPISAYGDTITIRRFVKEPWTIVDFLTDKLHSISVDMAAFLWQAIQYEMNMLIVGGTASGKTSTLNTLAAMIPPNNRIVTIEDTRELNLPQYLRYNWVPLVTRSPGAEGKGGVDMLDLMVASLRMRPDRVIVGEVRRREEAEVLFEAMHTGHAVYSTMHADTGDQVIRRMSNPPFQIPGTELESLHLIVVMYRDRRTGVRRVYEIDEVTLGVGGEVNLSRIFRWRARNDSFEKVGESTRVFGELSMHAGMSIDEIMEDLHNKETILQWMLKNNIRKIDQVGGVMSVYYKDASKVIDAAERNLKPEDIL